MVLNRLLPIILIGGGYLISKSIFTAYPLKKGSLNNVKTGSSLYLLWTLAFLIITGQLLYIVKVFTNLFQLSGNLVLPFFLIPVLVISMYALFFFKKK